MGRKQSYKSDIVKEYLQKYPNASTRAIARLLVKDFPLDFSESNARTLVQIYRGEHGKNSKDKTYFRNELTKKQFMKRKFELPESDYEKTEAFIIPKGQNNILVLSDIHIPYQDNKALEIALNYGLEHNVNAVYLNGDTIDYGYLQHGKAGRAMRTGRVLVKNEYADRWLAHYEGRWRRVHIQVNRLYIVAYGERIMIQIEGV